jgi:hypothetical protein
VEFVEKDRGDIVEPGLVEDAPREYAFGHHLDTCLA